MDLIGDIVERDTGSSKSKADFPTDTPISATGFPQHKRRWKTSAFKQQRSGNPTSDKQSFDASGENATSVPPRAVQETERQRIDRENRQRLADMSPDEIAEAQQDLLKGMNPALIQRLLSRANIDDTTPSVFEEPKQPPPPEIKVDDTSRSDRATSHPPKPAATYPDLPKNFNEDEAPAVIPPDLFPITDPPKSTHFPAAPNVPDLDPSDPNFLQTLHDKYFPNLPADPSRLAWMAPIPTEGSVADKDSSYYPHPEISLSSLRFDFRGRFLSPRVSRAMPPNVGLHHHGEAPESAGYTISELAHLARSSVPAQRCISYQTLGRILFRLGNGEWGTSVDDVVAMGIWNEVKKGKVLDTLNEAASVEGGHQGSKAYATEALWLFEKGGWREKVRGR